jgi:predicted metal-dependent enzyme (double-stranded beta helix superfamily)
MSATAALATALPWQGLLADAAARPDPIARGRTILGAFLAEPARATGLPLERRPGGYARNFLFGDETMSVWAMTWAPGCATSIHDHHCSCCFAVLAGTLTERWFEAVGADRARLTREALRGPGFSACMLPSGPNIHQVVNATPEEAISLHVYGFDRAARASSVEREYRLAAN